MPYREPARWSERARLHEELLKLHREIERANSACVLLGGMLALTCGLYSLFN